jgi:YgiT-type zinc finger domain-containing protein
MQEKAMKCVICKLGETRHGYTSVTLERNGTTIVIKEVPAQICENCGEYYLSDKISEQLLRLAEKVVRKGTEVEVLRFVA